MLPFLEKAGSPAMLRTIASWINLTAFVLSACSVDACAAQTHLSPDVVPMGVSVTTIQKGNFSGIREASQVVVRTQDEWSRLWRRHTSIQSPASPPPVIDFSAEMVVGLFAGEKSTGGYEVELTKGELKDSTLYIYYVEKSPISRGMAIQSLTQPFQLARLPKQEASVIFVKVSP